MWKPYLFLHILHFFIFILLINALCYQAAVTLGFLHWGSVSYHILKLQFLNGHIQTTDATPPAVVIKQSMCLWVSTYTPHIGCSDFLRCIERFKKKNTKKFVYFGESILYFSRLGKFVTWRSKTCQSLCGYDVFKPLATLITIFC